MFLKINDRHRQKKNFYSSSYKSADLLFKISDIFSFLCAKLNKIHNLFQDCLINR